MSVPAEQVAPYPGKRRKAAKRTARSQAKPKPPRTAPPLRTPSQPPSQAQLRVLDLRGLQAKGITLHRNSINRLIEEGEFPRPFSISRTARGVVGARHRRVAEGARRSDREGGGAAMSPLPAFKWIDPNATVIKKTVLPEWNVTVVTIKRTLPHQTEPFSTFAIDHDEPEDERGGVRFASTFVTEAAALQCHASVVSEFRNFRTATDLH